MQQKTEGILPSTRNCDAQQKYKHTLAGILFNPEQYCKNLTFNKLNSVSKLEVCNKRWYIGIVLSKINVLMFMFHLLTLYVEGVHLKTI